MKSVLQKARDLFFAFHERAPKAKEIFKIAPPKDATVLKVGSLDGLIYTPLGERRKYIHKFKRNARPVLVVTHDGDQIYILAGEYKFTERGFEK